MSQGTIADIGLWGDADIAIADVGATLPTDPAVYGSGWAYAGLLDGSAGIAENQSNDSTTVGAWGKGIVLTRRKNNLLTVAFTVLEENDTTQGFRYDNSGLTTTSGVTSGDLVERDLNRKMLVGFDVVDEGILRRWITKNYAQVDSLGATTYNEDGAASTPVTLTVYPDDSGAYWRYYMGPTA